MSEPQAFLNGRWLLESHAKISLTDAGFVLGATISEQLRTFAGRLFRTQPHVERLFRGLDITGIDCGMSHDELAQTAEELAARNHPLLPAGGDLGLAMLVTPGPYGSFAAASRPTVCLHTYPLPFARWAARYTSGVELLVSPVEMVSPAAWPPELKCRSRMHYYLAQQDADRRAPGAIPLLLSRDGTVRETPTANILLLRGGELLSPPRSTILPGISLAVVEELSPQLDLTFAERELVPADVAAADEVWLTSTPWCALPVTRIEGNRIGNGQPGPQYQKLMSAWQQLVGVDIVAQASSQTS